MNPTTIACAIAFLIGGAAGFSIEYAQVLRMEKNIVELKLSAETELKTLTARTNAEILTNIETNATIDASSRSYDEQLKTLNSELNSARLRKSVCRKSSSSSESTSNSSRESKDETDSVGVPEGLHEFLTTRTLIADRNSAYAIACYNFVIEHNCGIPRTQE